MPTNTAPLPSTPQSDSPSTLCHHPHVCHVSSRSLPPTQRYETLLTHSLSLYSLSSLLLTLLSFTLSILENPSKKEKKMLVEALPSIWASVHGWFTPAVLFVLLNVVIATIAVTSARAHHHHHHHDGESEDVDATSSAHGPTQPRKLDQTPEPETKPENTLQAPLPPVEPEAKETHIIRSRSDTEPVAGEMLPRLSRKMKKSASAKSAFAHFEFRDADVAEKAEEEEEEREVIGEVDARADDFINRFRHQLKLQRMDSIVRYKETIKRAEEGN